MIEARIQHGCVEPQQPIPAEWEGQIVRIEAPTPDDPQVNLEQRLASLHALGPMEFDSGEREAIAGALTELDAASRAAMSRLR